MARENILVQQYFVAFKKKELNTVGDVSLIPDLAGQIIGEVSEGVFLINKIRVTDFQSTGYQLIGVKELEHARFFFYEPHFKRECEELFELNKKVKDTFTQLDETINLVESHMQETKPQMFLIFLISYIGAAILVVPMTSLMWLGLKYFDLAPSFWLYVVTVNAYALIYTFAGLFTKQITSFAIKNLSICWFDEWTNSYGLEIFWGEKELLRIGFRNSAESNG